MVEQLLELALTLGVLKPGKLRLEANSEEVPPPIAHPALLCLVPLHLMLNCASMGLFSAELGVANHAPQDELLVQLGMEGQRRLLG